LLIGFLIAFIGVGFPYWQLPYAQVSLPDSLYGPGLAAIAVVALMARAFGLARFWKVWLLIAAAVPAAVLVRIIIDTTADATTHNLWPFELAIAIALGLVCSLVGSLLGSLLLTRSSKRPG
jgi:hypothetical protein